MLVTYAKKGGILLVLLFCGYYMFTDPAGSAALARTIGESAWGLLTQLFAAVIEFLDGVAAR